MQDYRVAIRKRRESLGYSQRALAGMVGKSQPFISEIESGKRKPSIDVLYQICETLKMDIVFQDREP